MPRHVRAPPNLSNVTLNVTLDQRLGKRRVEEGGAEVPAKAGKIDEQ
jgi:hypothetical protein